MQLDLLEIILLVWGAYYLYSVIFKPTIFWERRRILRTRELIGDQRTLILYTLLAVIMIGAGVFGGFR